MTRSDDDTWDIASSVGITAVTVAASRAYETSSTHPLIDDPVAAVLIASNELRGIVAEMTAAQQSTVSDARDLQQLIDYHAARTKYFDDYFEAAAVAGIRQHVILASGLDARAFRLQWPQRCVVFEIDQPAVLDYKTATLREHQILPKTSWKPLGTDLRSAWDEDLCAHGFDVHAPTAWLAEGLLPFLSAEGQDDLFTRVEALSAPGSRVAVEAFNLAGASLHAEITQQLDRSDANRNASGKALEGIFYGDERRGDPVAWWAEHGWQATYVHARDYLGAVGRPLAEQNPGFGQFSTFVTAKKPPGREGTTTVR